VCASLRLVRSIRGPAKASSDGNSVLCPPSVHNVPIETCQRPKRLVSGAAINGKFVLLLNSKPAVVSKLWNMDDEHDFNGKLLCLLFVTFHIL